MPLQNRVTPFGAVVASPERGSFMGNRGCIHHADGRLKDRTWANCRWIICRTDFKGQRLPLRDPGCNTQLFFLDEATALAAGHRPCWRCRRPDAVRFRGAWLRGNPEAILGPNTRIGAMDAVLHGERVQHNNKKVTYRAKVGGLADGVFVVLDHSPDAAFLIATGRLWRWTPGGYADPLAPHAAMEVTVLTPHSTANAIMCGYDPVLHAST